MSTLALIVVVIVGYPILAILGYKLGRKIMSIILDRIEGQHDD